MLLLGLLGVELVDAGSDEFTSKLGDIGDLHRPREGEVRHPRADTGDSRLVVNTWTGDFSHATARAWEVLSSEDGGDVLLDAIEQVQRLVLFDSSPLRHRTRMICGNGRTRLACSWPNRYA